MTDSANLHSEVYQIDAVGLVCPLPILRFKKRTKALKPGTEVEFLSDDPSGKRDLISLCDVTGHQLKWVREEQSGVLRYRVVLS